MDERPESLGLELTLRRLSLLPLALALAGCLPDAAGRAVVPGDLPPISRDYRDRIEGWARHYYAAPVNLAGSRLSDPTLARDSTGRLLWLVCLDVDAGPFAGGRQLHAFGFAPDYVSVPLRRNGSSINRDDCRPAELAWRPWSRASRRRG